MKTLYLRIYLTVVAVLLLFALVAGWLLQRNIEGDRECFQAGASERLAAWGELLQNALPPAAAPPDEQAEALLDWSARLRLPLALDDAQGARLAASPSFARWGELPRSGPGDEAERRAAQRVTLTDGRVLWLVRPSALRTGGRGREGRRLREPFFLHGSGLLATLCVLFAAVAIGAYPVVRRLTRRLEVLKPGVETFGAGALHHRVDAGGRDEVAAVASSFNAAAARIESLVR